MNDIMVSIRMPESLLSELRAFAEKQHCMDVSEAVRSIVRNKWLDAEQPELREIEKLRADIKEGNKRANKAAVSNAFFMVPLLDMTKVYYVSPIGSIAQSGENGG